jgi:hypothetical protein
MDGWMDSTTEGVSVQKKRNLPNNQDESALFYPAIWVPNRIKERGAVTNNVGNK